MSEHFEWFTVAQSEPKKFKLLLVNTTDSIFGIILSIKMIKIGFEVIILISCLEYPNICLKSLNCIEIHIINKISDFINETLSLYTYLPVVIVWLIDKMLFKHCVIMTAEVLERRYRKRNVKNHKMRLSTQHCVESSNKHVRCFKTERKREENTEKIHRALSSEVIATEYEYRIRTGQNIWKLCISSNSIVSQQIPRNPKHIKYVYFTSETPKCRIVNFD